MEVILTGDYTKFRRILTNLIFVKVCEERRGLPMNVQKELSVDSQIDHNEVMQGDWPIYFDLNAGVTPLANIIDSSNAIPSMPTD
jgi:hypothetical protein